MSLPLREVWKCYCNTCMDWFGYSADQRLPAHFPRKGMAGPTLPACNRCNKFFEETMKEMLRKLQTDTPESMGNMYTYLENELVRKVAKDNKEIDRANKAAGPSKKSGEGSGAKRQKGNSEPDKKAGSNSGAGPSGTAK